MMKKSLDTPIQYLKGIGPQRAKILAKAGIYRIEDLLYYFPRRYEDRSHLLLISRLKENEEQTIQAQVLASGQRQSWKKRRFSILEVVVGDASGKISCVWFNQPYLKNYFSVGTMLILHGRVERYGKRLQMNSPEFEILNDEKEKHNSYGIVPVYRLPEGMTQRYLRKIISICLDDYLPAVKDFLPYDIRARNKLLNLARSLRVIHFPLDLELQKAAYQRLAFEEFFLFQVPLALRKLKNRQRPGVSHQVEGKLVDNFLSGLEFTLTASQKRVIAEIKADMARASSMQRLLQGDVGSGKTVVATLSALVAIQGGYQAAILVPTEILAKQHYDKISSQFAQIGGKLKGLRISLLSGGLSTKEKAQAYKQISQGKAELIIGTHALLEGSVKFKQLGLVVIDEQHKFGVGQRALLPQKGFHPDVLIMTATPIPRTLAITLYGDLDISVINELPPGRKPVSTQWLASNKRNQCYDFVKANVREGRQVYIVYPVIEESEALGLLSAKKMYAEFKKEVFKEFSVGLIHGRLKEKQQESVMNAFHQGKIQIIITTTVLEVGIDVANASVMVIEQAERFGLSQLHQLRGRIGRGPYSSFCILLSDTMASEAQDRLTAMVNYSDGFRIAEEDLKIRGPGEFFGERQHGLSELRIANPLTQLQLLKRAREEAIRLLDLDPQLESRQNSLLREKLLRRFPEYEKLMVVG